MRWLAMVALGVWVPVAARAELPRLVATRATESVHIDGRLTETSWQGAFTATPFTLMGGTLAPSQATVARVLFDDGNLYFGFECNESRRGAMVTLIGEPDGPVYLDDCVEVFVAPGSDPMRYYHFVINAAGVLRDELRQDETWNSRATAAARPTPDGWSAELAVPLADLDIPATAGREWRLNLCREERPYAELSSWAPTQQGFHEPERFGWLTDLDLNLAPYVREGVLLKLRAARAELDPGLEAARAALPLAAARAAVRAGTIAQEALNRAAALALPSRATVEELQQAEAALAEGAQALAAMQAALPEMRMGLVLRQRGLPTQYAVCAESSMARVRPDRPYVGEPARELRLSLAANESEATQLVVVPIETDLREVRVSAGPLKGPAGASIPEQEVVVRRVGCVKVTEPSARSGAESGLFPDPLPANAPVDIARGSTAAWLITVHAPPGQPAGTYAGKVSVQGADVPGVVLPLTVTVWGFELPKASALRTCFRLIPSYLWKHHDLPPAPGVPVGWEYGVWTGADVEGRPNYFGTGVFRSRFDTSRPHSGKRALCIRGEVVQAGTHESPRACYQRLFPVQPNTDYTLSVWYRTEGLVDGGAQTHVHTHNAHQALPAASDWTEARLAFNSGDQQEARVYLGNYAVGEVYFDDVSLAPTAHPEANVVDDPSFEQGGSYEDRERLLRAYRLDSLAHRCSDMDTASPDVQVSAEGRVSIDWANFDREVEFYLDHGLNALNVGWARVPGGWGTVDAIDPKALEVSAEILRQTEAHLESKGWLDLAYVYTIDEPGAEAFYDVKQAFDHVRRAAPKLKRLLTFGYGASLPMLPGAPRYRLLEGYVDIWVPHSDCFDPEYLETRRRAGEEVWEYVCISAQKPYGNIWGIDFPGTDPRVVFWQCWAERITGFLYWATDYWERDPWQEPLTYPGGNGDGSLIYYGADGPVDSLRWETIRDGIEDYDTLALLQGLVQRAEDEGRAPALRRHARELLDVSPVTRSYTDYTTSPSVIEEQREKVGRLAERLSAEIGR
ncbi:MAG: DUF4091 domain-containing protein [Armatimonadetes bacterium]|nr:DUF4091 domain-containing protein [Armatimonadota bacterium]